MPSNNRIILAIAVMGIMLLLLTIGFFAIVLHIAAAAPLNLETNLNEQKLEAIADETLEWMRHFVNNPHVRKMFEEMNSTLGEWQPIMKGLRELATEPEVKPLLERMRNLTAKSFAMADVNQASYVAPFFVFIQFFVRGSLTFSIFTFFQFGFNILGSFGHRFFQFHRSGPRKIYLTY
jgi:hypothetical protein